MTMILNREQLRQPAKRRYKIVTLPIHGGAVRMQSLLNSESRKLRQMLVNRKGEIDQRVSSKYNELIIANVIVDEDGYRLFSDEEALGESFDWLDAADAAVLLDAAKRHTGLHADESFKAIEGAVKNSDGTRENCDSGDSASDSGSVACMSC